MTNAEYFNILSVTGKFPKGSKEKLRYMEKSSFEIANIHRKLEDSKEFNCEFIINLCYKWTKRFEVIKDFEPRLVDKVVAVARFRRTVMKYKTMSYFEEFLLKEDFIENKISEVIRYLSIYEPYGGLNEISLLGKDVIVSRYDGMLVIRDKETYEIISDDTLMILFKNKGYKLINELRTFENNEYDFAILQSRRLSKYLN